MRSWILMLVPAVALSLPGAVEAQAKSKKTPKQIEVQQAASVWNTVARQSASRDVRDRDDDSDSDSDSDARRGRGSDRWENGRSGQRGQTSCVRLERQLEQAHDEWHRRNDRYRGSRGYEQDHDRLHSQMDRAMQREGCQGRTGTAGTLEDIIFGRRGGTDDRGSRPFPGRGQGQGLETAAGVLEILLGGGRP